MISAGNKYKLHSSSTGHILLQIIFFLSLLQTDSLFGQDISNYMPFTGWGISKADSKEVICLRKFNTGSHSYYFAVDPQSLDTGIISSDSLSVYHAEWGTIRGRFSSTPYIKALQRAAMYSDTIQDAGFTRFRSSQKGIDLTIDLCPSIHPLDRIVFKDLIAEIGKFEKPVPLAISITGKWINAHFADFRWLDSLEKTGILSIVWINHSYDHYTAINVPLKKNFMLAPATDINAEVLKTEILLLNNRVVPSIFFRFPGLVSDHEIFNRILNLGLIPLGSDAWLAKGQLPGKGSIVLIHANGNEPIGVRDFIELLKNKRSEVLSRQWELFDLRESLIDIISR
jgi:hypothetical protein